MTVEIISVQEGDRDRLFRWRNLPEVRKWMFSKGLIQYREHCSWFARMIADTASRYWIIRTDDWPVGLIYLNDLGLGDGCCRLGIYLAESSIMGRGVARAALGLVIEEAFGPLGQDCVKAEVMSSNDRAIALYESFGMRRVRHERHSNSACVVLILEICRRDWCERKEC
jgi:UDP-4-amino-4,6-dideoxy-N-acetyl-beta-L-altrosamine N-acetyltransferase